MHSLFKIRTQSSRHLGTGLDHRLRAEVLPAHPALLRRVPGRPTIGFMAARPDVPLTIDDVAYKTVVQPWRIRQVESGFVLLDPASGAALVERVDGSVGLQEWEEGLATAVMQLLPVEEQQVPAAMSGLFDQIETVLPRDLNGPDMLDVLARALTVQSAGLVQAVLRLLPRDQTEWLGGTLLGLPDHLARLSAAFPGDIWATKALPELREWLHTRKGASHVQLPPEWDFLAEAGLNGRTITATHTLSAAARASVPPRRPVCVVATARNEGLYLLEWIAYHRLVGAEALFIYSNDNSDGSDDLLRALALAGEITWIENHLDVGRGAQPKAYGHAFGVMPGVLDYRWSLVIDLDEFFGFDIGRFRSLPDYIAWQETQRVDAISLNWLVYGSGGASAWSNGPMVERFTKRLPWIDPHIKSLSRTNLCIQSHPHHAAFSALMPIVTRDSSGGIYQWKDGFSFSATPQNERAWVSHYFLKSAEEFIWKFSRNRGDHALSRNLDPALIDRGFISMFVQQHRSPTMIDDPRSTACAPGLREEIERLCRLPGVEAAFGRVQAGYAVQIQKLVSQLPGSRDFSDPTSPLPEFVRLCL